MRNGRKTKSRLNRQSQDGTRQDAGDADRIAAVATGVIECETADEFIARAREVQRVS